MNTALLLLAQYGKTTIPLEEICEPYFACSLQTAIQKARVFKLPIPAFQLGLGQKAPWFVHITDLAGLIDRQRELAQEEWDNAS